MRQTGPPGTRSVSAASPSTMPPHEVLWWSVSPGALSPSAFDALASVCSVAEVQRAARYLFDRDRRASLAAHGLLRQSISADGHVESVALRTDPATAIDLWRLKWRGVPDAAAHGGACIRRPAPCRFPASSGASSRN